LSDAELQLNQLLKLPVFQTAGMTLYKRLTLIIQDGVIEAVHYPIFPSDSDVVWVLEHLKRKAAAMG
jgi:peroxiredoxin